MLEQHSSVGHDCFSAPPCLSIIHCYRPVWCYVTCPSEKESSNKQTEKEQDLRYFNSAFPRVGNKLSLCLTKYHGMNTYGGIGGTAPRIPDLGTRWRWVVSFTPRSFTPQGKKPPNSLDRRLGGPQRRSGRGGEEKNFQPLPGLEPPIIQPVAQSYTTELTWLQWTFEALRLPAIAALWYFVLTAWSSPPLETSSQEIPRFLWNLKVHYRVHKIPPLVRNPSQMHPDHTHSTLFL
jgi:hypothetical protein